MEIKNYNDVYSYLKDPKNSIYDKVAYTHERKTNNKSKNIQVGRLFVNLILPDDYELVDMPLDSKSINLIISDISKKYPPEKTMSVVQTLNEELLKMTSFYPATLNPDTLKLSDTIEKRKKTYLTADIEPSEFSKRMSEVGSDYVNYLKDIDSGLYDISKSGTSKSSPTDLCVFFIAKGPVSGFTGEISKPILNNLNKGFTLDEYYQSCDQARFANYIRSNGTA